MATLRELREKINNVTSSKRITGTIEMVATSKMKILQNKLKKSGLYAENMNRMIANLLASGIDTSSHVLLQDKKKSGKVLLLIIAGNRGLCAGFNTKIIDSALSCKNELRGRENREVFFYVIGKKAVINLNYINENVYKSIPNPEDKLAFEDACNIGSELTSIFKNDEFDEIYLLYTRALSFSTHEITTQKLLPMGPVDSESGPVLDFEVPYLFDPDPGDILSSIIPLSLNIKIYNSLLESGYAEQATRKVSMKNATDSAADMIQKLTVSYNRVRQAKITDEITEIVAGAAALK